MTDKKPYKFGDRVEWKINGGIQGTFLRPHGTVGICWLRDDTLTEHYSPHHLMQRPAKDKRPVCSYDRCHDRQPCGANCQDIHNFKDADYSRALKLSRYSKDGIYRGLEDKRPAGPPPFSVNAGESGVSTLRIGNQYFNLEDFGTDKEGLAAREFRDRMLTNALNGLAGV